MSCVGRILSEYSLRLTWNILSLQHKDILYLLYSQIITLCSMGLEGGRCKGVTVYFCFACALYGIFCNIVYNK